MKEIIGGVYRVGEVRRPEGAPIMLVHPWFREGEDYQPFKIWAPNWRNYQGDYQKNLNSLIASSRGKRSLLLVEQGWDIESSVERISRLFGKNDFYVIESLPCDCEPRANPREAMNFLTGFGPRALLAGGYVRQNEVGYGGCLGCFREDLESLGVRGSFANGCCYTWPN